MAMPTHDRIRGVFSSQEIRKVGTGATTRKTVSKVFWFVEEDDGGNLQLQSINSNFIPTGNKKTITKEDLIEKYSPEPEFYIESVYPKMRQLNETIDRADVAREKGETFTAEFEYDNALNIDIENVRANFGIGLTYLSRGDKDKAENIFERLINLNGAYDEEHKHLFNEFGINLRKSKMLQQSIDYYLRAIKLTKSDENLFINVARVYLELKDFPHTLEFLSKALKLDPSNETALKFISWMQAKNLITVDQAQLAMAGEMDGPPIDDILPMSDAELAAESAASGSFAPDSTASEQV